MVLYKFRIIIIIIMSIYIERFRETETPRMLGEFRRDMAW